MDGLCSITARGGSKRIPHKNIKEFCGKPIIAYSIEAALKSGLFDEVMVSTDDVKIADVARRYGAAVPFMRSDKTSNDFATTADVLEEVLDKYEALGNAPEWFCCLYPTAPFATDAELRGARSLMLDGAPGVVAVTSFDFPPQRGFATKDDGSVAYAYPEYATMRSQDLPQLTHDCGRFYFNKVDAFRQYHSVVMPGCMPYYIDPERVQDIDTLDDWAQAEFKWRWINR